MRRRHKAQDVAHERAHLAPSPEGALVTRSLSKPSATHPCAPEEETVRTVLCIMSGFEAYRRVSLNLQERIHMERSCASIARCV